MACTPSQLDASRRWREKNLDRCRRASRDYMRRLRAERPEHFQALYDRSKAAIEARNRAIIAESKAVPCADCGASHDSRAMDFHHVDPSTKEGRIASAVNRRWSERRLRAEIDKCVVLCASCHRLRHVICDNLGGS